MKPKVYILGIEPNVLLPFKRFKERRIWYYPCERCPRRAQSHKRKNAEKHLCRKCRRLEHVENQDSLFPELIQNKNV